VIIKDGEILQLIKDGNTREEGFLLLINKFQQKLYWHIRRMVLSHDDTDDVLQNTFIKVWKGLNSFREDSQLYTWLYRIATNEALTHLKKKKRNKTVSLDEAGIEGNPSTDTQLGYSGDEISSKLHKAVLRLPPKQQLVFNMKYFDELKYEEISSILGTTVGALKASYHLAVKKIENQILID
jgi:RNA polymerase sigma factor (sigma-70 family)